MKVCCEFSKKIFVKQIEKKPISIEIEANTAEKKALAVRFTIPDILSLTCHYQLSYFHGGHIRAEGKLKAVLIQNCVVSLEDFISEIEDEFELLFVPIDQVGKELEALDDPDVVPYDHDFIDIGEVTSQQLVLLLDPYPHKPDVKNELIIDEQTLDTTKVEKKENPFNVLKKLKKM